MMRLNHLRLASVLIACLGVPGGSWPAAALTPAGELAAHRAVYELKLASTRGKGGAVAARGRILYDFSGSLCEGYTLEFRQVSELDNGEGKVTLSDLRSTTWRMAPPAPTGSPRRTFSISSSSRRSTGARSGDRMQSGSR